MKLLCLTLVVVAGAVSTVSAAECTQTQLTAYGDFDQTPMQKACPLSLTETSSKLEDFTDESLKALEPCRENDCLTELKKFYDATPDCSVDQFNIKSIITATTKLCQAFGAGPVSIETANRFYKGIDASLHEVFDSSMDDNDDSGSGASVKEAKPSNATGKAAASPTTTKPVATAVPTPAPTAKSDAGALRMATGVALTAMVTIVTSLAA